MYADYDYYMTGYLLGKAPAVPEMDFPYWEKQARDAVDSRTFGRIREDGSLITEKVKDCVCAITELLYKADSLSEQALQQGEIAPLVSYSNDRQSGTFDLSQSIYTEDGKKARIKQLIYQYLGDSGLLYAGVSVCR